MIPERERDQVERAAATGRVLFTAFLDPAVAGYTAAYAKSRGLEAILWGGCDDAERVIVALHRKGVEIGARDWPLNTLEISWDGRGQAPGHRDILGALLGLGISRDQVGDIRIDVQANRAWVCMGKSVGAFALDALSEVGHVPVSVREHTGEAPPREAGIERKINVNTTRLDAVLASALNLSRGRAQELVREGRVKLNWAECSRADAQLKEGDTLSIRGRGRVRVLSIEGLSRKGRLFVLIESFLEKG